MPSWRRVVVVEGAWGVGKTTLCRELLDQFPGAIFLPEPPPCPRKGRMARMSWYTKQHQLRLARARASIARGGFVVMERSLLSTLAYHWEGGSRLRRIFQRSGYSRLLHIVILGPCGGFGSNPAFGEAREMRFAGQARRYREALLEAADSLLDQSLIIPGRYHRSDYFKRISVIIRKATPSLTP